MAEERKVWFSVKCYATYRTSLVVPSWVGEKDTADYIRKHLRELPAENLEYLSEIEDECDAVSEEDITDVTEIESGEECCGDVFCVDTGKIVLEGDPENEDGDDYGYFRRAADIGGLRTKIAFDRDERFVVTAENKEWALEYAKEYAKKYGDRAYAIVTALGLHRYTEPFQTDDTDWANPHASDIIGSACQMDGKLYTDFLLPSGVSVFDEMEEAV